MLIYVFLLLSKICVDSHMYPFLVCVCVCLCVLLLSLFLLLESSENK